MSAYLGGPYTAPPTQVASEREGGHVTDSPLGELPGLSPSRGDLIWPSRDWASFSPSAGEGDSRGPGLWTETVPSSPGARAASQRNPRGFLGHWLGDNVPMDPVSRCLETGGK